MQGIGYFPRGLCLMNPRFIVSSRYLLNLSFEAKGREIFHGSCRGGWSARPKVYLLHLRSMSFTLDLYRFSHGVQYGGLVAPPLYVLQCIVLRGCLWGFSSVLALWCSQCMGGGGRLTREGRCVVSVNVMLCDYCRCGFWGRDMVGVELWCC